MIVRILQFGLCLIIYFFFISYPKAEEGQRKEGVEVFINGIKFKSWEEYRGYQKRVTEPPEAVKFSETVIQDPAKMKTIIIPSGHVKEKTIILGKPPDDEMPIRFPVTENAFFNTFQNLNSTAAQKIRDFFKIHFWPKETANIILPAVPRAP